MKFYYAIFKKTAEAVEVEFPDLPGCVTFGKSWEEAVSNATDVLAGWLANADPEFIKKPSSYKRLKSKHKGEDLLPIPVDEKIMASYEQFKRVNVIFPTSLLNKMDDYRMRQGLKRSTLLQKAVKEFLDKHNKVT